jgi:hypothetical protein
MSVIRQIILCLALPFCAQTAVAEIIQISANTIGGLRFESSAPRHVAGPRTSNHEGSVVANKLATPQNNISTSSNTEKTVYSPSISDAVIGALVLLLGVGAAGGLARAQRPSASRW